MASESVVNSMKEALLLIKVFNFYCAFCGKPLRIGEGEIVVSEDFDLYHYRCHSEQAKRH